MATLSEMANQEFGTVSKSLPRFLREHPAVRRGTPISDKVAASHAGSMASRAIASGDTGTGQAWVNRGRRVASGESRPVARRSLPVNQQRERTRLAELQAQMEQVRRSGYYGS